MPHQFVYVDKFELLKEAGLVDTGAPVRGELKIVVAGNKACGKTCLISALAAGESVDVSSSIAPQVRRKSIAIDDPVPREIPVLLKEVPTDGDFSHILKVACYRADAVLLCFALDDPVSLDAVPIWRDEVQKHSPDAIRFVVGCKRDLKDLKPKPVLVSIEKGVAMAVRVGAVAYITCSAKSGKYIVEMTKVIAKELAEERLLLVERRAHSRSSGKKY